MHFSTLFITTFLLIQSIIGISQNEFKQTLVFDSLTGSPDAKIADAAWIKGHWRGKVFGGTAEEIWSPPLGGSMMCVFKLVAENQVQFYEIVTISEENNSLILRLKHFHANLKGWEEKDETVDFPLVKLEEKAIHFDGFSFIQRSSNEMDIYVMLGNEDDSAEEILFKYHKVKSIE